MTSSAVNSPVKRKSTTSTSSRKKSHDTVPEVAPQDVEGAALTRERIKANQCTGEYYSFDDDLRTYFTDTAKEVLHAMPNCHPLILALSEASDLELLSVSYEQVTKKKGLGTQPCPIWQSWENEGKAWASN